MKKTYWLAIKSVALLAVGICTGGSAAAPPPARQAAGRGCEAVYDLYEPISLDYPLAYLHLMRGLISQEMAPFDGEARQHRLSARRQYLVCGGVRHLLAEWTYARTGYLQHAVVYAPRHDLRQQRRKLWEWRYTYPSASDSAFTVERLRYRYQGPDTLEYVRTTPGRLDLVVYWQRMVHTQRRPDGTPYRVALPVDYRYGMPPAGTRLPYQQAFLKDSLTSRPITLKQRVRFDGPGRRVVDQQLEGSENPITVWDSRSEEAYAADGKLRSAVVDYAYYSLAETLPRDSFDLEQYLTGYRVAEFDAASNRLGYLVAEFSTVFPCIFQSWYSTQRDLPTYYALMCTYKTVYANGLARQTFVQDWRKQDERSSLTAVSAQARKKARQLSEARAIELRYEYEVFK